MVRLDALSCKWEDRPKSTNPDDDDRVKNWQRILLTPDYFNPAILEQLTNHIRSDPEALQARPATLVPTDKRPIDDLVDQAYTRSPLAIAMLACL